MAESTGISWADATFNPWVGCTKHSPGCDHCYAEVLVTGRMGRAGTWGKDGVRERTSAALWRKPYAWAKRAREGLLPDGSPNLDGHRPRVFCASLADVFEPREELAGWRWELFTVIEETPELDWLVLTKRPGFAAKWLTGYRHLERTFPLPNLWLGTSIESARFTYRARELAKIPAVVRFISAEPLLGSLFTEDPLKKSLDLQGIDWVIVGGESGGRNARPMHPAWAREIREAVLAESERTDRWRIIGDCEDAIIRPAFHFKQFGSHDADGIYRGPSSKASGKSLDGEEWCEFPEPRRTLEAIYA